MEVVIGRGIHVTGLSPQHAKTITDLYTIDNPTYVKAKARKRPTWGMERKILLYSTSGSTLNFGRGTINDLSALFDKLRITDYSFKDERHVSEKGVDFGNFQNMTLRAYQESAVASLVENEFGIVDAPAGSGKTIIGLELMRRIKQPTLWLVHTEELILQAAEKAKQVISNVGKVGFLYGNCKDIGDGKLVIASVKTLALNPQFIELLNKYIGCIILDEAHHAPANTFSEVLTQLTGKYIFGLTATPYRPDGLQPLMEAVLGPVRKTVTRQELYDSGCLIKPQVIPMYTEFMYSQASIVTGTGANKSVSAGGDRFDYPALLEALFSDVDRISLIANNILHNVKQGNCQLVLADNKEYLKKLGKEMNRIADMVGVSWPRTAILTSDLNKADRAAVMRAFREKGLDVVFATQLAREGLDIEHLNIVHITTPRKGDVYGKEGVELGNVLEQEVGRVMRPDPCNPKKKSIIYDYVDYETTVLKGQYRSRCMVYKRLLIDVPRKPTTKRDEDMSTFFKSLPGVKL